MTSKVLQFLCATAFATASLQATSFSFQGSFVSDDQIQLFGFAISSNTVVTLKSLGYGGGTNGVNAVIPAGGFDPLLTLFQSDGTQVGSFDDDPGCAHTNLNHGACLDSYFNGLLQAGSYQLALTESGNFSLGNLSDGFLQQGQGNFTANNCSPSSAQGFCDTFGNQNNGNWALDIIGVNSATQVSGIPEPSSLSLAALALALLGIVYWRRMPRLKRELISGGKK
ncbi:MAG: sorting protein [Bryobacterales bacterium]|nr:sorting protein [Bryobacterales bacterium]